MRTHEENGIIYFDEPYIGSGLEFCYEHLDCDSIMTRESGFRDDDVTEIVAYASTKEKNHLLHEIFHRDYGNGNYVILQHIGAWEAAAIV